MINRNTKLFAFIGLIFIALFFSCSKNKIAEVIKPEPEVKKTTNNPLITERDKLVDDIVKPFMKNPSSVGLSIGIMKDGQFSYYGYGVIAKNSKAIPDEHTAFEIGSISKTFTSAMAVRFIKENNLSLESPIAPFLPKDIPVLSLNGEQVRFKHLMNHTSGLPRLPEDINVGTNPKDPYRQYDTLRLYSYLKTARLLTKPGTAYLYSNLAFGILSSIIERNTKTTFAAYLRETIADPLSLNRTRSMVTEYSSNLSHGYDRNGDETPYWDGLDQGAFKGAGSVYSSAQDLIKYAGYQINPPLTSVGDLLLECQKVSYESGSIKIGLAWRYVTINNLECLVHDGLTSGYTTYLVMCKSKNIAVVILSNQVDDDLNIYFNRLASAVIK